MQYKIGDRTQGGIVFQVDDSGEHGVVAAESDQVSEESHLRKATWFEAKKMCSELKLNGYDDWYLPEISELNGMYYALHIHGNGNFSNGWYWSSEKRDYIGPWGYNFRTGDRYGEHPLYEKYVRAVRAF